MPPPCIRSNELNLQQLPVLFPTCTSTTRDEQIRTAKAFFRPWKPPRQQEHRERIPPLRQPQSSLRPLRNLRTKRPCPGMDLQTRIRSGRQSYRSLRSIDTSGSSSTPEVYNDMGEEGGEHSLLSLAWELPVRGRIDTLHLRYRW